MAFSCGFYNSLNGDRKYNARQVSELFDGIIRDGVYASIGDKFTVKQGTGMQIIVGTGRAWFNHSWSLIDAEYPLTVDQSDLILDRIDAVVLEVNESTEVRDNSIKMVKGTAASSPQKPTMTDTEFVHQYPLAYILVKKGSTEITTADIEINVGKDDCPYVTSILEAVSIEELYAQWEAQFKGWEEGQKTQFEEWFGEIKGQLGEDVAGNLQIQVNDVNGRVDNVEGRVDNEGIQIYTHSKSGTVHKFTGNGPNGRAKMKANVSSGDTFTVNGSPVTAYMGAENAVDSMAGNAWSGKWITFVFDGNTINFKGGGGLSAADKAKLIPENIKAGVTINGVTGTLTYEDLLPDNLYIFGPEGLDPIAGDFQRFSGVSASGAITISETIDIPNCGVGTSFSGITNLIDFSDYNTLIVQYKGRGNWMHDCYMSYGSGVSFDPSSGIKLQLGEASVSWDISKINTKNRLLVRQYRDNEGRTTQLSITQILLSR